MAYDIQLNLPAPWRKETETYDDESGAEVTHLEARLDDMALIDIYAGDMPSDMTAEDQAYSNYADIVGFAEDDPEDFNPISQIKFKNRSAYVFHALCEDESPMMFLSQEIRKGVLIIMCCAGKDDDVLQDTVLLVERNLRVK